MVDQDRCPQIRKMWPRHPCPASIHLSCTKTTNIDDDASVLLIGGPLTALKEWLERARIVDGAVSAASIAGDT
ncbi:MAG: hypothetical protein E5V77_04870, partial [Mesorhizobium sp.]